MNFQAKYSFGNGFQTEKIEQLNGWYGHYR